MKKKYVEPKIKLSDTLDNEFLLNSGDFGEGESIWDNELPLVPIDSFEN